MDWIQRRDQTIEQQINYLIGIKNRIDTRRRNLFFAFMFFFCVGIQRNSPRSKNEISRKFFTNYG